MSGVKSWAKHFSMKTVLLFLTSCILFFFSRTIVLAGSFFPNIFQSIVLPELRGEYTPYTILIDNIIAYTRIILFVISFLLFITFLVRIFSKRKQIGTSNKH